LEMGHKAVRYNGRRPDILPWREKANKLGRSPLWIREGRG
jgi:hypothetical protein